MVPATGFLYTTGNILRARLGCLYTQGNNLRVRPWLVNTGEHSEGWPEFLDSRGNNIRLVNPLKNFNNSTIG